MTDRKTEKRIDEALEETFPASDPPANSGQKTLEERQRRDAADKRREAGANPDQRDK